MMHCIRTKAKKIKAQKIHSFGLIAILVDSI